MDDLIARLEAATGAERELDWLIAEAMGLPEPWIKSSVWPPFTRNSGFDKAILRFTASINAALTLVPEGKSWTLQSDGGPGPMAFVDYCGRFQVGATPALAICIAALKARGEP